MGVLITVSGLPIELTRRVTSIPSSMPKIFLHLGNISNGWDTVDLREMQVQERKRVQVEERCFRCDMRTLDGAYSAAQRIARVRALKISFNRSWLDVRGR